MFMKIEKLTRKAGRTTQNIFASQPQNRKGQTRAEHNHGNIRMCKPISVPIGAVVTSDNDISREIKVRIQKSNSCFFGLQDFLVQDWEEVLLDRIGWRRVVIAAKTNEGL